MKPPVPYVTGWQFTVQKHIPPSPTKVTPDCCINDDTGEMESREIDPVERCLLHPPLQGSYNSSRVDLHIHDTLRVGDNHNAQLVVVDILAADRPLESLEGKRVVAKIYDPLYFDDDEGYINPFASVDKHYTHEAELYKALSDLQGSMIPLYYGAFSLDIFVNSSTKRCVRLILIEFVPGLPMRDCQPHTLPRQCRQSIMKSVVDFETLSYTKDILLTDTHPRNIILVNTGEQMRAVFIDFGDALFGRAGRYTNHSDSGQLSGIYISPLLRWHKVHRRTFDFDSWIDWDWQHWLEAEYKHTAESITQEMRDKFLPNFLLGL